MSQQDTTSDLLTRVRNAVRNRAPKVRCLNNKLNRGVCDVLRDEGYIESYDVVEDGRQGLIDISLRYGSRGEPIITRIDRVSRPGRRVYRGASDLPRPLAGLGICIVSTSRGVLSDRICREQKLAENSSPSSSNPNVEEPTMSRIGTKPVPVPGNVKVAVDAGSNTVGWKASRANSSSCTTPM